MSIKEEETNYLRVSRMIKCGNCYPEKYEDCKELRSKYKNFICDCVCHIKKDDWRVLP